MTFIHTAGTVLLSGKGVAKEAVEDPEPVAVVVVVVVDVVVVVEVVVVVVRYNAFRTFVNLKLIFWHEGGFF